MKTAIEKIRSFERFGSILGLERMHELMRRLQNPERGMKYIHVAGTNGKGSVCRYLYEILRENGYRTGLFTSPFVQDFHERIEFNGQMIPDGALETCTGRVLAKAQEMVEDGLGSPTEFEVVTAVAFVYFQSVAADIVVLEVGLGGTGDSTNIIESPLICLIASISFDHMDRLGTTLSGIAAEKAGIIKEGVPVVVNVTDKEAAAVIARVAKEKKSTQYNVMEMGYTVIEESLSECKFHADICGVSYENAEISMIGAHQVQNALTALTAVEVLQKNGGLVVSKPAVYRGLKKAKQIGRFEIMLRDPYVILDGAHNEQGACALRDTVLAHFAGWRILMVTGILADKDASSMLRAFGEIAEDFIATEPESVRKLPADVLCEMLLSAGKRCCAAPRPAGAFRLAMEKRGEFDVILFAGSFYLIGEIRRMIHAG